MSDESNYLRPRISVYQGELVRDGITAYLDGTIPTNHQIYALTDLRDRLIDLVVLAEARQKIRDLKGEM